MPREVESRSIFQKLMPLTSSLLIVVGMFADGRMSGWYGYAAWAIAVVLLIAWLVTEISWAKVTGPVRVFLSGSSKLSKAEVGKVRVLMDETAALLSDSFSLSPMCVWHSAANKFHVEVVKAYDYQAAVGAWFLDLRESVSSGSHVDIRLLKSISINISELSKLAVRAQADMEKIAASSNLDERGKKVLIKEWDAARDYFNNVIARWRTLFKEVNGLKRSGCVEFFKPLDRVS